MGAIAHQCETVYLGQAGSSGAQSREQRFDAVIKELHSLPAEEFQGRADLMVLSAHELKVGPSALPGL